MAILKVIHKSYFSGQFSDKKYHDSDALCDVISYCLLPAKTPSKLVGGFGVDVMCAVEQMELLALAYRKDSGVRLRHFVLSFQAKERIDKQRAFFLAQNIAMFYGGMYQIIFAVHEDTARPHIHFVMNTVSYIDGRKYAGDKSDYFSFQQHVRNLLWGSNRFRLIVVPDSMSSKRDF